MHLFPKIYLFFPSLSSHVKENPYSTGGEKNRNLVINSLSYEEGLGV